MSRQITTKEAEFKKLFEANRRMLNGRAEIVVGNSTPPDWGLTIVEAGVKFFYHDGTDEQDGPRVIHLQPGQRYSFFSTKPEGCVQQAYTVLKIRAISEPDDAIMDDRDIAPPNKCIIRHGVFLAPKLHVSAEEFGGSWEGALQIISE